MLLLLKRYWFIGELLGSLLKKLNYVYYESERARGGKGKRDGKEMKRSKEESHKTCGLL